MARRRQEEDSGGGGGNAPWMNTFADLMNLLLCFFVLLFSMSTVDATKYQAFITSFTDDISIFEAGGDQLIGEENFPNSGTDQIVSISEYYKEFDEQSQASSDSNNEESNSNPSTSTSTSDMTVDEAVQMVQAARKSQLEKLEQDIEAQAQMQDIADVVEIATDPAARYVQILLKSAVLFDTGDDSIKPEARPILQKIAKILITYKEENIIQIEGHTDNVPISGGRFGDNMELSGARAYSVFRFFRDNTVYRRNVRLRKIFEPSGRGEYEPIGNNNTAAGRARNRRIEFNIEPNVN